MLDRDVICRLYLDGLTTKEIARHIGEPWPRVHMVVFDLKRSGVLPKRPKREAA